MSLGYKQVEAVLVEVLKIKPAEMGAFRARLRHLRNLGVPRLPKPGSGRRIGYSEDHAFVMLIALELEDLGIAPRPAADVAPSIVRMHGWLRGVLDASSDDDLHVAVTPRRSRQWVALSTRSAFDELLAKGLPAFSLLNMSICARKLDHALRAVV